MTILDERASAMQRQDETAHFRLHLAFGTPSPEKVQAAGVVSRPIRVNVQFPDYPAALKTGYPVYCIGIHLIPNGKSNFACRSAFP